MLEGLGKFFEPGASTVIFLPFLLLFVALGMAVFIGAPLFAVTITAIPGSLLLCSRSATVTPSFARFFVYVAFACQFVFIFFAITHDAPFLFDRPRIHPAAPIYLLALVASANSILNLSVATVVIRYRLASPR